MAGGNNYTLYTQVQFDNGQAIKAAKELANEWKRLNKEYKVANKLYKDMKDGVVAATNEEIKAQHKVVQALRLREQAQRKAVQTSAQDLSMLRRATKELDNMSLRQLNMAMSEAKKKMNSLGGGKTSQVELQAVRELMDKIQLRIKGVQSGFQDLWNMATSGAKMSMTQMQSLINIIEQDGNALAKNTKHYEQMGNVMQKLKMKLQDAKGFGGINQALFGKNGDASKYTDAQLQSYMKFYDGIAKSAQSSAKQVADANKKVERAQTELSNRATSTLMSDGSSIVTKVNSGNFSGTIKQTEEAIQKIQLFKKELATTDINGIQQADQAIAKLKADLQSASETVTMGQTALNQNVAGKSIEDLNKMKAALEAYKKSIKSTDTKKLQEVNSKLIEIQKETDKVTSSTIKWEEYQGKNLNNRSLTELKNAYKILRQELEGMSTSQANYNQKAAQMRNIDQQIKQMSRSMEHHASTLQNAASRLVSYVGIYMGFNAMLTKTQETFKNILNMSDEMAKIQKVSGLSSDQVVRLTKSIQGINTRTARHELLELGLVGGKLGVAAEHGVNGLNAFVESANKMNASLGEDLGGAKAITSLMKVNQLMGNIIKGDAESITNSLDKTASAILRIGNTSTASYGYVADFSGKLGGTAAQAGLAMDELLALAGAMDVANVNCSLAATAMQRFLTQLRKNPEGIAHAIGGDANEMKKLKDEGKTMEEMLYVLEKLKGVKLEQTSSIIKTLMGGGKNQQQSLTALNSLIASQDKLRELLLTSSEAYDEGTAAAEEYRIMNESAAGSVERIGNAIKNQFVNGEAVKGMESFTKGLVPFFEHIDEYKSRFILMLTAIGVAAKAQFNIVNLSLKNLKLAFGKTLAELKTLFIKGGLTLAIMAIADVLGTMIDRITLSSKLLKDCTAGVIEATRAYVEQRASMAKLTERYDELSKKQNKNADETKELERVNRRMIATLGEYFSMDELIKEGIVSKTGLILDEKKAYDKLADAAKRAAMAEVGASIKADNMKKAYNDFSENQAKFSEAFDKILESIPEDQRHKYNKADIMSSNYTRWMDAVQSGKPFVQDPRVEAAVKTAKNNGLVADQSFAALGLGGLTVGSALHGVYNAAKASNVKGIDGEKIGSTGAAAEAFGETLVKDATDGLKRGFGAYSYLKNGVTNWTSGKAWNDQNSFTDQLFSGTQLSSVAITSGGLAQNDSQNAATLYANNQIVDKIFGQFEKPTASSDMTEMGDPDIRPDGKEKKENLKYWLDLARKRLEEYYTQEKVIIQNHRNNNLLTEGEYNRQMYELDNKYDDDRISLEMKFLNQIQKFSNEKVDAWMQTYESVDGKMETIRYDIIHSFLGSDDGKRYGAEITRNMDKIASEIRKRIREHQDKIKAVILDNDVFGKLFDDFTKDIDMLEVLMSGAAKTAEDTFVDMEGTVDRRMNILMSALQRAYTMDANSMREFIEANGVTDWALNDEQMNALLIKLREYSDLYEETLRKSANKIKKQVEMQWTQSSYVYGADGIIARNADGSVKKTDSQQDIWNKRQDTAEKNKSMVSLLQGDVYGGVSRLDGTTKADDAELELYRLKIEASQAWIDQLNREMEARIAAAETEEEKNQLIREQEYMTAEARKNVADNLAEYGQKQAELANKMVEKFTPYADMVNQFASDFGDKIFGSKKEREEAARALLSSFVKTTGTMLAQYLSYTATRSMLDKTMAAQELTTEGTEATATVMAEGAKGTAKEVGRLGFAGFATGAAITAGISLLVAMILAQINRAKSQLGISTGKLTTGMLTYANGMYPTYADGDGMSVGQRYSVQGTDGETYNAKYQPRLTTGKYNSPHMGIVGEKGAELIVDHPTLSVLEKTAPWVLGAVYDAHRFGRLGLNHGAINGYSSMMSLTNGRSMANIGKVRTYADGNVEDVISGADFGALSSGEDVGKLITDTRDLLADLRDNGIDARVALYGRNGLMESIKKGNEFYKSVGK